MQKISAAKFKAQCLELMDIVKIKHTSLIITKHGIPVAKLVPIDNDKDINLFGALANTIKIMGDITEPTNEEWDAMK